MSRNEDLKCAVCGSTDIKKPSGLIQREPYYCSSSCTASVYRHLSLVASIAFFLLTSTFIILAITIEVEFVILVVFSFIFCIFLFIVALTGYSHQKEILANKEGKILIQVKNIGNSICSPTTRIESFKIERVVESYTCRICKLYIRKSEFVYQCPQCDNYFHQQHLDEWLDAESTCPVCGYRLK